MLPVNGNVNAMPRKISCKLEIGGNTITEVKQLTYAQDWSGDISIGQVVSSYITATIPTPSFGLTGVSVSHSMGIGTAPEWVPIGQYQVDESSIRTRQGYTSFSAYDKLHDTVNTYHSELYYPATLQAVLNEVCRQIGITSTSLGINFTVEEDILSGYTLRDVLGFCAAMVGKNAYLSPSGALELRWFTASGYTADGTRANVPYIGESNCTVNRLICQAADGVLTSGTGEGIYFTCPIMTQARLDSIRTALAGFSYRKADVDIPYGNFCLQSGDIITVTTTGSSLTVPIMANSWTYDGGLSSSVSAYGVSDYSGTANNAERSATAQRVQGILDAKRAVSREQQQYIIVSGEIQHATELITGATGGYIKLEFGGNGKTAQLLVMDQPSMDEALNVWIFNQNGLGHIQRATTSDPFSQVNVALTREGTVVAERIAGQKISGVKIESTSEGAGSQPQVVVEDGNYTINRVNNGSVTNIGAIAFKDRTSADGTNTIAIQVQEGNAVTIGTKGVPGVSNDNPEFFYYSDPSAQSGREKFMLWNGNVRLFAGNFIAYGTSQQNGDVKYGIGGSESLLALKDTVDSMLSALIGINTRLDDLERRVTDLENR
jgi:hypothetical protein